MKQKAQEILCVLPSIFAIYDGKRSSKMNAGGFSEVVKKALFAGRQKEQHNLSRRTPGAPIWSDKSVTITTPGHAYPQKRGRSPGLGYGAFARRRPAFSKRCFNGVFGLRSSPTVMAVAPAFDRIPYWSTRQVPFEPRWLIHYLILSSIPLLQFSVNLQDVQNIHKISFPPRTVEYAGKI